MELLQYEKEHKIPVYEIGADGKLSLHSLFNYLQDIASEHATKLNFGREDLIKENHFWVLSRILAKIEKLPEWEDEIIVRTWPRGVDKLFAIRDFELCYPGGKQIVTASSSWLVVDRTTKRVQRPYNLLSRFNSDVPVQSSVSRVAAKLEPASAGGKKGDPFRVKISELDVNMHTNNAMYVKWVCDVYEPDFMKNHSPVTVEINYLAESKWNYEICVKTSCEENSETTFLHSVIRLSDNVELCRVRFEWMNCSH
jgi:medium-chain acyl-[acyl-carrier-protein] hydrolase